MKYLYETSHLCLTGHRIGRLSKPRASDGGPRPRQPRDIDRHDAYGPHLGFQPAAAKRSTEARDEASPVDVEKQTIGRITVLERTAERAIGLSRLHA